MSFDLARVAPEKAVLRPALPSSFMPGVNGTHMTKMTYREQLLHPNWQRKRLETLEGAGWKCQACKGDGATLHVHHKRYVKGRMAWEYAEHELAVLCAPCHAEAHTTRDEMMAVLCFAESFPQAGITERDLAVLASSFMLAAGNSAWQDEVISCATSPGSSRVSLCAHIAGRLFSSDFENYELGDMTMLVDGREFDALKALLAEARARLEAEINADNAGSPDA